MSNRDDSKEREEYFVDMRQQAQSESEWFEIQIQQLREENKNLYEKYMKILEENLLLIECVEFYADKKTWWHDSTFHTHIKL